MSKMPAKHEGSFSDMPTKPSEKSEETMASVGNSYRIPRGLATPGVVSGTTSKAHPFLTRKVEYNPTDVNHPEHSEIAAAQKDLKTFAGKEQEALGKLSGKDIAKYQSVKELRKKNPQPQRNPQKILLDGPLKKNPAFDGKPRALAPLNPTA